jgi:ornithine--oxo-acid transaminase
MAPHADNTATPSNGSINTSRYHAQSTEEAIEKEDKYAAHNYHPLPVVFSKASGVHVEDPEGRKYLDFLSAYSAVNQGHCHPELVKALSEQAGRLTLSSRAFYNDVFPKWAEKMQSVFGYDMVLPMNTGAEAVETAVKIARKWAYKVKGVPQWKAIVFAVADNFHGRTVRLAPLTLKTCLTKSQMTAISMSTDPESRNGYGPFVPNVGPVCASTGKTIRYNNIGDLEEALEAHGKETAAFIVEPIQGEAGVVVPDDDYLTKVHALCKKHNVLLICDEIQTGIGRTGRMLCSEWAGIKPDMVTLGKAISGGMYPVSCVLSSKEIMLVIEPGTHGSTYGGNPLGCAVSIRALEIMEEENLMAKAERLGHIFRDSIAQFKSPIIKTIRGKGLLNAVVIDEAAANGRTAWDLCILLKEKSLLVSSDTFLKFLLSQISLLPARADMVADGHG